MKIVHTSEYPRFINSLLMCFVDLVKNKLRPQVRPKLTPEKCTFTYKTRPSHTYAEGAASSKHRVLGGICSRLSLGFYLCSKAGSEVKVVQAVTSRY